MRDLKGQMFTMDMALSMVIFLGIAGLSVTMINSMYDSEAFLSEEQFMEDKIYRASDILIETEGFPLNWTHQNYRIPGIAEENGVVSARKLLELKRIPHQDFRTVFRIPKYGFRAEFLVDGNITGIGGKCRGSLGVVTNSSGNALRSINSSGYEWDVYWFGGGEAPEGYRKKFEGSSEDMLVSALENRSEYNCIMAEGHGEDSEDIRDKVSELENTVFVQIGAGKVFDGVSYEDFTGTGEVVDEEILSEHLSTGDNVNISDSTYTVTGVDKEFLEDEDGECGVCRIGGNYFFTHSKYLEGEAEETVYEKYFFGGKSVIGEERGDDADDVIPLSKNVVLKRESGKLIRSVVNMVLWK